MRLPTPIGKDRDEREYVINRQASTGGIQRFKAGHHGSAHGLAALIAYVQKETPKFWQKRVAGWINDLVEAGQPGWRIFFVSNTTMRRRESQFIVRYTQETGIWEKLNCATFGCR